MCARELDLLSQRLLLLLLTLLAPGWSGCAAVQVRIVPVVADEQRIARTQATGSGRTAAAAEWFLYGQNALLPAETRLSALLEAARLALPEEEQPGGRAVYRSALRGMLKLLGQHDWNLQPDPATAGFHRLRIVPGGASTLDPRVPAELIPADQIKIGGLRRRSSVDGLGLPMVAWFRPDAEFLQGQPGIPPAGMAIPATAVVTFSGPPTNRTARLELIRTLDRESARVSGTTRGLAADFSAPLAKLISKGRNRLLDIGTFLMLNPQATASGLFQFQPYDPQKTPVVFVHGLLSRPEAWQQALNELLADPQIRHTHQFWFYLYPTGLPVWASAAGLRAELDRFNRELARNPPADGPPGPAFRRKVLIGHSMGGLLSSLQIRRGGDLLWGQFSDVDFRAAELSPRTREIIEDMIFFEPRPDVATVIFVATPHRGSPMALRPAAGLAAWLIRLPLREVQPERGRLLSLLREDARRHFSVPANSIRFLRANSPLLLSILELPRDERVVLYSIIGDRGRGDAPHGSDGIVPHWSSILEGAAGETVVASNHSANEHPAAIAEIGRILRARRLQEH